MNLALVIKGIELVQGLIAALKVENLTDEEKAELRARRDALNQRLAELDVQTEPPPS